MTDWEELTLKNTDTVQMMHAREENKRRNQRKLTKC